MRLFRRRKFEMPVEPVARALASHMLRYYDIDVLERGAVLQFLRTRYMRLSADYGLPTEACNAVAERALELVSQAQKMPIVDQRTGFAFYE